MEFYHHLGFSEAVLLLADFLHMGIKVLRLQFLPVHRLLLPSSRCLPHRQQRFLLHLQAIWNIFFSLKVIEDKMRVTFISDFIQQAKDSVLILVYFLGEVVDFGDDEGANQFFGFGVSIEKVVEVEFFDFLQELQGLSAEAVFEVLAGEFSGLVV